MGRKDKGQHFMVDENVIKGICDLAELTKDDVVLEIGPGTGNLTKELVGRCKFVHAIETDRWLVERLEARLGNCENLEVIGADATKVDFPKFDKIVSNLPYSISKKITEKLLGYEFDCGILVYQREFARKLVSEINRDTYRYISALAQSCADVEILSYIRPEAFSPKPHVYSAIVRITPKIKADKEYIGFLHGLFNHRNKKIGNSLECGGKITEEILELRPFELTPKELREIYEKTMGA